MRTFGINVALITSLWLAASGCVADEQKPTPTTSAVRGVATYDVESSASLTSVVGRDSEGNEVLRLDLTHGRIPVTADIRESFPRVTEINARPFDVYLEGRNVFFWAVKGFASSFKDLPGPSGDSRVREFLQEPHVKAVFDQWQIGFNFDVPVVANGEEDYSGTGTFTGTTPVNCYSFEGTHKQCGTVRTYLGTPVIVYNCGSSPGTPPTTSVRMTRAIPAPGSGTEWTLAQFCPTGASGKVWPWVASKTCPLAGATKGVGGCLPTEFRTGCGCVAESDTDAACAGCPGGANEASYYGSVTNTSTVITWVYYALADTIGYWNNGGSNNFFNATQHSTQINEASTVHITMYVSNNWSVPINCTGSGTTGTCNAGGASYIDAASPSSSYTKHFNPL